MCVILHVHMYQEDISISSWSLPKKLYHSQWHQHWFFIQTIYHNHFVCFGNVAKKPLASNCLNLLIYACLIINNILIPHSFMICGFIADWLLKQSPRVDLIEMVREWRKDRHTETHVQRTAEIKWSGLHGNWEWLSSRVEQGGRVLTSTQRDKVYVYRSAKAGLPTFSQSSL